MTSPRSEAPPALVGRLVLAGALTALVGAGVELGVAVVRAGQPPAPAVAVRAFLHLVALLLPVGLALGVAAALALLALRAHPWSRALVARARAHGVFEPDPRGFSAGLAALVALAGLVAAVRVTTQHFATRYHDQALAAWANAAAVVALLGAAALAAGALAALLRPWARRLGRAASLGVLALLIAAAVVAAVVALFVAFPALGDAYDPLLLGAAPAALAVLAAFAVGLARALRRSRRPGRGSLVAGVAAVLLSAAALAATATTYGGSNRVRALVERHSVTGVRLLRGYARFADRDGDGHATAFGGEDCDDRDASVHPGAPDPEGDGVDADCFDGDGSRDVADLGDGRYGAVPPRLRRPNVLLVMVDALRPDRLGCFGYDRNVTPHIDALCHQAVRFRNTVASSSRSLRSIPAMMTGTHPSQVAFGPQYLYPSIEPSNETVAEALAAAGYGTAVSVGTNYFARSEGFFQGFGRVFQSEEYTPRRELVLEKALEQLAELREGEAPWFLWVYLFNVHAPYLHDGKKSPFGTEPADLYDAEVQLADAIVGKLLDALAESGEADDTVVFLLSDHGEAFGEHGNYGHATTLYEEELRSTLLVRAPGVPGRTVGTRVSLIDFAPTVLNMAGVAFPRPTPARSLLPYLTGHARDEDDARLVFAELLPDGLFAFDQKALYRGDSKLVWWVRDGAYQLFDLAKDPGERFDVSDDQPDRAREMLGLLRAWVSTVALPENRRREVIEQNRLERLPDEMTERLDVEVGGAFTIVGFDLPKRVFEVGETIPITFYYRVDRETRRDYFFYVDIQPAMHDFHAHHFPLNGSYHTDEWKAGELLRDRVEIVIPPDHPRYGRVSVTLQLFDDGRRVPLRKDDDRTFVVDLAELTIVHPGPRLAPGAAGEAPPPPPAAPAGPEAAAPTRARPAALAPAVLDPSAATFGFGVGQQRGGAAPRDRLVVPSTVEAH